MKPSVGVNKSVNTEAAVMSPFTVVAAVSEFKLAVGVIYSVVCPFPDTAAHKIIILIEKLPIFFKSSGTYTHCMGVFTKEEGLGGVFFSSGVLAGLFNIIMICIHF